MIEMRNDIMRRANFDMATKDAAKEDFNYAMYKTMEERLAQARIKQMRPKRKIPWFTIITVVTTIPFLMNGGIPSIGSITKQTSALGGLDATQIQQAISTMQQVDPNQTAKVTIEIDGKIMQREISIEDLKALQSQ